ncbi:ATP-binding protein [Pelagicoccus enzymogenes]|uniref:ATP-binding protein n=1 Tax=Pelagicoccus enzymogenes TaxID=2773457 RepID=UPI00280FDE7E|nr:ATP-binding protein [Pelagicoccus enzymogenes]MDQ8200657.1 ATP-binding protein [Pelagicoccus enzymogenes]
MPSSSNLLKWRFEILVTVAIVAGLFLLAFLLPSDYVERLCAADYMPHGHCYFWEPDILWLHVGSDSLVALSYFTIPLCLVLLVRRRKGLRFRGVFWLFSLFILFCGLTHVFEIYSVWYGAYRLTGLVKLATALASVATAIYLVRSLPMLIKLPLQQEYREVESKLSERDSLFRAMLTGGQEAFVSVNPVEGENGAATSFLVDEFNELAASELRGEGESLQGQAIDEALSFARQVDLGGILQGAFRSGEPQRFEFEVQEEEKEARWINLRVVPAGSRLAIFFMDVSAERLTEKRFRKELEERFTVASKERDANAARAQAAMSAAAHGILVVDGKGKIVQCNRELLEIFGYTETELVGEPVDTLVPVEARGRHSSHMASFGEKPSRRTMGKAIQNLSGRRKDGTTFPVEIGLNPFETPEGRFVCASVVDVTERLEARAALRESELLLQQATSGGNVGIWHWYDVTEDKLYWSPKMYELLGYEPDEFEASYEKFKELLHPEDFKPTLEALKNSFGNKSHFEQDHRLLTKKNGYRWFFTAGQLVEDQRTGKTKMVGSIIDVQKRKDHEREIEQINDTLASKNVEMEQMTYAVSHDLKAPLVSILGLVNLLEVGGFDMGEDAAGLLKRVEKAARQMQNLINDMLEMGKVGKVEGAPEDVDAKEVLAEVRDLFEADINRLGCEVRIDEEIPRIWTQSKLLRQAAQNLIANALKYGCTAENPKIEIFSRRSQDWVDLIVQDNGKGIPESNREDVFKLFRRLEQTGDGSGLGLAIVAKIMGSLNGRAFVEGHEGAGARFVLRFPLDKQQEPSSHDAVKDQGPRLIFSDQSKLAPKPRSMAGLGEQFKKFVYATAHDFNAPLVTIKGHLDFLLTHGADELEPDFRKLVEQSNNAANRMTEYLEALVKYGEAILDEKQTGTVKAELQPLVGEIVDKWRLAEDHEHVSIKLPQLPSIDCINVNLMRNLFENLLENAVRFASENERPEVELGVTEADSFWAFSIQDNGPGVASHGNLSSLAPFGRLGLQDVDKTGIGLATCKLIVELHGGEIWMDPDCQKGAKIHFTIRKVGASK